MVEEPEAGADREAGRGRSAVTASQQPDRAPSPLPSNAVASIHDKIRRIAERFQTPQDVIMARPALTRRADASLQPSDPGLSGLRVLMTVACPDEDDLFGDLAFEDALASAAMLFTHGVETVMVAVVDLPDEARRLAVRRTPGVAFWPEALPADAAGDLLPELAERARADLLLLHDAALLADRRSAKPAIVRCDSSRLVAWRALHGGSAGPPDAIRDAGSAEGRGLRAADLVLTPSRWLAEALAAAHELPRRPLVVAPFTREAPARAAQPRSPPLLMTAGRLDDEAMDLQTLDRAAACLDESVMAAGPALGRDNRAISFSTLQVLGGLRWPGLAGLLSGSPVFVSTARVADAGGLAGQAAARGCALVLSDIAAYREAWRGAAIFVRPGDHLGFAAALRRLSEDDAARAALSQAALRRMRLLSAMRRSEALLEAMTSLTARARLTAAE